MAVIVGTFSGDNKNMQMQLVYSYTQDVANNKSTVSVTLRVQKLTSYCQTYKHQLPYKININGSTVKSGTFRFDMRSSSVGAYINIATYSNTYTHNNDGTLSLTLGGYLDFSGTTHGYGNASQTVALPSIARSSTFTLGKSSYYLGDTLTGTIAASSTSFYHKVTIKLNNDSSCSSTLNLGAGTTNINYTIPTSWLTSSAFSNSTSTTCTVTVGTYKDSNYSTLVGSAVSKTCTLNISTSSSSVSGYFTFSVGGLSVVSNDSTTYNSYLLNKTKCKISNIVITPTSGSTIKNIKITGSDGYDSGTLTYTSGMSHTTSLLTKPGSIKYTITITDSRGLTTNYTNSSMSINVIDYTLPIFKNVITSRAASIEGNIEDSNDGDIVKCLIDFGYFTADSNNKIKKLEVSLRRKRDHGLKYKTFSFVDNVFIDQDNTSLRYEGYQNGDTYYYTLYWNAGLAPDDSYDVRYRLTDNYGTTTYFDELSSAFFILDISPNGKNIAIGKSAEEDENGGLEIKMPKVEFSFNGDDYLFDGNGFYLNNEPVKMILQKHDTNSTAANIVLGNNSCYYTFKKGLKSLNVSVDTTIATNTCCKVNFAASNTFDMTSDSKIYYVGTNCESGVLTTTPKTFYSIEYECSLSTILGKVFSMPIPDSFVSSGGSESTGGSEESNTNTVVEVEDGPEPFGKVSELITIAKSYYTYAKDNNYFEWGTDTVLAYGATESSILCIGSSCGDNDIIGSTGPHTNTSGDKRKRIDGETLVGLCLRGISFNNSKYASWNNENEFVPDTYDWALDLRDTITTNSSNGGIKTAAEIAKYCKDRRWMIDKCWHPTNFNKLKAGDLIFWDDDGTDNGAWDKISRVGICLGTEVIDTNDFAVKYPNEVASSNKDMMVLEVVNKTNYSGTHYGLRTVKLKDSNPNNIKHVARIQYKPYATCIVNNSLGANLRTGPSSSTDSSGAYIYKVIANVANGTKLQIIDQTNGRSKIWYKVLYDSTNRKTAWVSSAIVSSVTTLPDDTESSSSTNTVNFPVPCYGVDVSKHNGTMNWSAIKKADSAKFAILRIGFGGRSGNTPTLDSKFTTYLNDCIANNIPVGIYFFSYANSVAKAQEEANWVVNQLAKYPKTFEFPIFFDQEYDSINTVYNSSTGKYTASNPGKEALTNYMNAFCKIIDDAGYMAGIYANPDWFANYVNFSNVQYKDHIWIAQWTSSLTWNKADVKIWQTGVANIDGYSGDIDYDKCLFDYPNYVRNNKKNGF